MMPTLELAPVHQRRAHEYVAEELRRAILLRAVGPGERLPTEHELAELLGVSHITVREALRELERDGLLELRRGRLGGAYVVGVPALGDGPERLDELRRASRSVRAALEYRSMLEPYAAAMAAAKAGADAIEEIGAARDAVARKVDAPDPVFMASDAAFHRAIGRVADNPHVLEGIERIQADIAPALEALPESGHWHTRSIADHAEIVSAIATGDPDAARDAMGRHIEVTERATLLLLDGLSRRRGATAAATSRATR